MMVRIPSTDRCTSAPPDDGGEVSIIRMAATGATMDDKKTKDAGEKVKNLGPKATDDSASANVKGGRIMTTGDEDDTNDLEIQRLKSR
jgi:hypothetical protein